VSKKGKPSFFNTDKLNYGLTDVKEFLAEILINEDFRKYTSDVAANDWNDIVANNKKIRSSKSEGLLDLITNFFKEIFGMLAGKKSTGISIDNTKPVIENAAKLASQLFLSPHHGKPQFSKSVKANIREATDTRVKDEVIMNELTALKRQLKDWAKGYRSGFAEGVKGTKADEQHLQD